MVPWYEGYEGYKLLFAWSDVDYNTRFAYWDRSAWINTLKSLNSFDLNLTIQFSSILPHVNCYFAVSFSYYMDGMAWWHDIRACAHNSTVHTISHPIRVHLKRDDVGLDRIRQGRLPLADGFEHEIPLKTQSMISDPTLSTPEGTGKKSHFRHERGDLDWSKGESAVFIDDIQAVQTGMKKKRWMKGCVRSVKAG